MKLQEWVFVCLHYATNLAWDLASRSSSRSCNISSSYILVVDCLWVQLCVAKSSVVSHFRRRFELDLVWTCIFRYSFLSLMTRYQLHVSTICLLRLGLKCSCIVFSKDFKQGTIRYCNNLFGCYCFWWSNFLSFVCEAVMYVFVLLNSIHTADLWRIFLYTFMNFVRRNMHFIGNVKAKYALLLWTLFSVLCRKWVAETRYLYLQ